MVVGAAPTSGAQGGSFSVRRGSAACRSVSVLVMKVEIYSCLATPLNTFIGQVFGLTQFAGQWLGSEQSMSPGTVSFFIMPGLNDVE